jgi:hypothetical protein
MSADEFDNYCQGLADFDNSGSNVLKLIQINLKVLTELKDKQKLLKQETLKLQTDIGVFRQLMQNKFNACLNNNKENYTQNVPGFVRNPTTATPATTTTGGAVVSANPLNVNVLDDSNDIIKFNNQNSTLLEPIKPINKPTNNVINSTTNANTTTTDAAAVVSQSFIDLLDKNDG